MECSIIPKYCDANSILLINQAGILRRLYCPFRVECMIATGAFKAGMWLWVDEVAINKQDQLIYWIFSRPHLYTHFEIRASF